MILVIDTETTGLEDDDEIIQLSILDSHENIVLNRFYKPEHHSEWPAAQQVNHIAPEDVATCQSISKDLDMIQLLIDNSTAIIGYNTQFDIRMLTNAGIHVPERMKIIDVMAEFAPIYGEWSDKYGKYKWQKLSTCAAFYGYTFHAHDSMEDAKATLYCWKQIKNARVLAETHPF